MKARVVLIAMVVAMVVVVVVWAMVEVEAVGNDRGTSTTTTTTFMITTTAPPDNATCFHATTATAQEAFRYAKR